MSDEVRFPEDVAKLRAMDARFNYLSDKAIASLYSDWSQEEYCAGWLILDFARLDGFVEWCFKKEA